LKGQLFGYLLLALVVIISTQSNAAVPCSWTGSIDPGYYSAPYDIAVDSTENLYIPNYYSHTLSKYDSSGMLLFHVGTGVWAVDAAVAPNGTIYILDMPNAKVYRYDSSMGLYRCASMYRLKPILAK